LNFFSQIQHLKKNRKRREKNSNYQEERNSSFSNHVVHKKTIWEFCPNPTLIFKIRKKKRQKKNSNILYTKIKKNSPPCHTKEEKKIEKRKKKKACAWTSILLGAYARAFLSFLWSAVDNRQYSSSPSCAKNFRSKHSSCSKPYAHATTKTNKHTHTHTITSILRYVYMIK